MFDLNGRKALVTGASGGIGEAVARALHAQGATVGLHGTRVERLEALAGELGDRVKIFPANLSDRAEVKALGQKAEAELGGVDILVNNAGITRDGLFVRMSDDDWDAVLEVNLTAAFRLTRELTHPMMRRRYGRIVNITSIMGEVAGQGQSIYNTSKGAAKMMTQGIAVDCSGYNILVNAVAPGMVLTGLTHNMLGDPDQVQYFIEKIPQRRIGKPEEIAAAILFLCSEDASYINGATLHVDGGMLCTRM